MSPDPIEDLNTVDLPLASEVCGELMDKARSLPTRIADQTIRNDLQSMLVFDMAPVVEVSDHRITERLFQIYSHLANAFV